MASVDGLISGLNTSDIISQLMQLERQPQARLQTKQSNVESGISALRGLNTKFLAVATAADKLRTDKGWQLTTATSSDAARVTVASTAGAAQGQLSFNVAKLATASSSRSTGAWADATSAVLAPGTKIFLAKGGGAATEVDVGDGSLSAIAAAINRSAAGVGATVVRLGDGQVKLSLQSSSTGGSKAITVRDSATGGVDPFASTALGAVATVSAGQDAELEVFGQVVTRSSNTISDLLPGVTLTLAKADTRNADGTWAQPPATIDVKSDPEGLATQVAGLVEAINAAKSEVGRLTSYDLETKRKGQLYGANDVRSLRDRLSSAVIGDGSVSAGVSGVSVARDGTVSFDRTKFLAAVAKDPAGVQQTLGKDGLAGRLYDLGDGASRSKTAEAGPGLIASAVSSREAQVLDLKTNISSWDARLSLREKSLKRQYAGLETALGAAKTQGDWLSGQLAGLPKWS